MTRLAKKLRAALEDHPVVAVLGLILTCFVAGVTSDRVLLNLTGQEVIPRSSLEAISRQATNKEKDISNLRTKLKEKEDAERSLVLSLRAAEASKGALQEQVNSSAALIEELRRKTDVVLAQFFLDPQGGSFVESYEPDPCHNGSRWAYNYDIDDANRAQWPILDATLLNVDDAVNVLSYIDLLLIYYMDEVGEGDGYENPRSVPQSPQITQSHYYEFNLEGRFCSAKDFYSPFEKSQSWAGDQLESCAYRLPLSPPIKLAPKDAVRIRIGLTAIPVDAFASYEEWLAQHMGELPEDEARLIFDREYWEAFRYGVLTDWHFRLGFGLAQGESPVSPKYCLIF